MTAYELRNHLRDRHKIAPGYLRGADYGTLTMLHEEDHEVERADHTHQDHTDAA